MKRILLGSATLCAILFMISCSTIITSCSDSIDFEKKQSSKIANNNISNSDLLMNLERSFLPQARSNAALDPELFIYPDYYCGNYLKGDKVVILVKANNVETYKNDLLKRCKTDNFEIEIRDYSMNEILKVRNKLSNIGEVTLKQLGVCFWGIDPEYNTLEIVLENLSNDKINKIKSLIGNVPFLRFSKGSKVIFEEEVNPGTSFYEDAGKGYGSIGFRCTYKTKQGFFITSGHVMKNAMNKLYSTADKSKSLGTCRICDAKGIDAAVCEEAKDVNITNSFDFNGQKITLFPEVGTYSQHSPIGLKGRHNSSRSTIELVGSGFPDRTYSSFCAGTYTSQGGDSGGIIFNTTEKRVVGIHMGKAKKNGIIYSFFVPYSAIENKFGIRLY